MIEAIDTMIRLIAAGANLLLLILLLAGNVRGSLKFPLAGLLVGAAAYLIISSSAAQAMMGYIPLIDLASIITPLWLWLFARRLFEREPAGWLIWTLLAIFVLNWLVSLFEPFPQDYGFYLIHIVGLALVVDLVRVALTGRDDDLIEKRRKIRLWLPIVIAIQTGGILLVELIVGMDVVNLAQEQFAPLQMVNASLILALVLFSGLTLLKTDEELLVQTERDAPEPDSVETLSPSEKVLKDKLEAAMADGFYRTPGLSIAGLADHLDTPKHRLRALINQRLGYRNFAAFLNGHRIAEAKTILSDPAKVDLPVLTIAMDLGYNSLPTFNRAFRSEASETPTDFRKNAIGQN